MEKGRYPIHKKGDRNAVCPFYMDCLDDAIEKSWKYWDCCECKHKSKTDPFMEVPLSAKDSIAYYDLPTDIYVKVC